MIKFIDLKKGDKILHSHLGTQPPVSGYIMESPKQGRGVKSTILVDAVSYTHLRAHETPEHLVCRLLLEACL